MSSTSRTSTRRCIRIDDGSLTGQEHSCVRHGGPTTETRWHSGRGVSDLPWRHPYRYDNDDNPIVRSGGRDNSRCPDVPFTESRCHIMQQHTLAFKVRTGTEELAAALLCSYEPPRLKIDDHTSLLATAVFISGDQVVRSIEVEGDLAAVSRHLATDPNIRKVEGQLVQYLAEPYDLADPMAARASFQRRLMKQVGTIGPDTRIASESRLSRLAVKFPIPAGTAEQVARLLAGTGESSFPECDVFVRLAIFAQGDSTLVGIVTTDGTIDQSLD